MADDINILIGTPKNQRQTEKTFFILNCPSKFTGYYSYLWECVCSACACCLQIIRNLHTHIIFVPFRELCLKWLSCNFTCIELWSSKLANESLNIVSNFQIFRANRIWRILQTRNMATTNMIIIKCFSASPAFVLIVCSVMLFVPNSNPISRIQLTDDTWQHYMKITQIQLCCNKCTIAFSLFLFWILSWVCC